jgi:hypothetical protein
MDGKPAVIALGLAAPIPDGTMVDGSVAELQLNGDGTITAEIRIPGNQRDGYD